MIVEQMKFENEKKKIKLKRIENYNDNIENNKILFYLHLEGMPTKSFRD